MVLLVLLRCQDPNSPSVVEFWLDHSALCSLFEPRVIQSGGSSVDLPHSLADFPESDSLKPKRTFWFGPEPRACDVVQYGLDGFEPAALRWITRCALFWQLASRTSYRPSPHRCRYSRLNWVSQRHPGLEQARVEAASCIFRIHHRSKESRVLCPIISPSATSFAPEPCDLGGCAGGSRGRHPVYKAQSMCHSHR